MTGMQYDFAARADSKLVRDAIFSRIPADLAPQVVDHDPVAGRMNRLLHSFKDRPEQIPDVVLNSERRLAASMGRGFLITCQDGSSVIKIIVCETCVQIFSRSALSDDTIVALRSAIVTATPGDFEDVD